jgi:hypothetical protein
MRQDECFYFGAGEGSMVGRGDPWLCTGYTYEASSQGGALFWGDKGGPFRAARWELWEVI